MVDNCVCDSAPSKTDSLRPILSRQQLRPSRKVNSFPWLPALHSLLVLFIGALVWAIFYPGIFDPDSFGLYKIACSGQYYNTFPPVLALLMQVTLSLGEGPGPLILFQCLAGSLGVHLLSNSILRQLFAERLSPAQRSGVALIAFLLLISPLSPLLYYLANYRNDTWLILALLWDTVIWLRLAREHGTPWNLARTCTLAMAFVTSILALLARHNAIVLLPLYCLLAWTVLARYSKVGAVSAALVFAMLPGAISRGIDRGLHVRETHNEQTILGLDLVGICVEDESLRACLPFTNANLVEDRWRSGYWQGSVHPLYGWSGTQRIVKPEYMDPGRNQELVNDYLAALCKCPGTLALVKVEGASGLLLRQDWWHFSEISPNEFGLKFNTRMEKARRALLFVDKLVQDDPTLMFVVGRHLLWFLAGLFWTAAAGTWWYLRGGAKAQLTFLLVLLPLGYYASVLIGVTDRAYRFLYPGTLLFQILTLTALLGWGLAAMKELAARAPQEAV